jgi:hypothetical protein
MFERTKIRVRFNSSNKNPNSINSLEQESELVLFFRTERVHSTMPNPKVERPSSGSTQPDDHSRSESENFLKSWDLDVLRKQTLRK